MCRLSITVVGLLDLRGTSLPRPLKALCVVPGGAFGPGFCGKDVSLVQGLATVRSLTFTLGIAHHLPLLTGRTEVRLGSSRYW